MFGLSDSEMRLFRRLTTAKKIQDFLDTIPVNFEKKGQTYMSPRRVLKTGKAHCLEGALLAACALWIHGTRPLLMDLTSKSYDDDHVVALFRVGGYWGALSKTNHAVLRYRDPIYKNIRELALSYFHEYYMSNNGVKTLVSYSRPLDLRKFGSGWVTDEKNLHYIAHALDEQKHYAMVPKVNRRILRPASAFERTTTDAREWLRSDPRT